MKNLGKVGVVGRFKPLHNGVAALLESLCESATEVVIGVGSSNKYNLRNPYTADETGEMIDVFLKGRFDNYRIIKIPDFAHIQGNEDGVAWRDYVFENFGELDCFVSGNDFVRGLLGERYEIIHPGNVVPDEKKVLLRATRVRYELAIDGNWQSLVPEIVAKYIEENGLDERFRREFGLKTIASVSGRDYNRDESAAEEKIHARER